MSKQPHTSKIAEVLPETVAAPSLLTFKEEPLPSEPATDRKLVTKDGSFRERIRFVEQPVDGGGSANHHTALITLTKLDRGKVVRDAGGRPIITPVHEIVLTLESVGRMGDNFEARLQEAREIALARASVVFDGAARLREVIAKRSGS